MRLRAGRSGCGTTQLGPYYSVAAAGPYYSVAAAHQLLAELDLAVHLVPDGGARAAEIGGLSLGYNVTINETVELITQAYLDIPQRGEPLAGGLMAGFILTLASGSNAVAAKVDPALPDPRVASR